MFKQLITCGCLLAALTVGVAGTAEAQFRGDKAVYFTFSQPVAVPGVTLPAGKYLFRLADSLQNRSIVQIYEADGSKLHAMVMTLHAQRPEPSDDPEIRFLEAPANQPAAVATWWYPGERNGWEFIYPREQAEELARSAKQSVLTTADDGSGDDMKTAKLARVTATGEDAPLAGEAQAQTFAGRAESGEIAADAPASPAVPASSTSAQPSAAPASAARPAGAPSARSSSAAASASAVQDPDDDDAGPAARTSLPATASAMPVIWSSGVLALIGAFGMRFCRRSRTPMSARS